MGQVRSRLKKMGAGVSAVESFTDLQRRASESDDESEDFTLRHLFQAAERGDLRTMKRIVEENRIPIDITDNSACTPLFMAAKDGHHECVSLLLRQGALADGLRDVSSSWTPLWIASSGGHTECVRLLIDAGANLECKYPETPLYVATREGHAPVVKLLLQAGALTEFSGIPHHSLIEAAMHGHRDYLECIHLIALSGCDLDEPVNQYQQTALHLCSINKNGACMNTLLAHGASVNVTSNYFLVGVTPLHLATKSGCEHLIKLLVTHGADVYLTDENGRRASDWANSAGKNTGCYRYLKYAESNPRPLVYLARWAVRKTLGRKRLQHINDLAVPPNLVSFLWYKTN
ncbi:ankyrin repeat and SOCS box protein 13-like [Branchiostoma lanceolatum]|uniref:ASB13 protein n=1 Tax=Branchiostoma lanceolatum TaxID=7740 RepID=A0A8K0ACQ9_BRALA|nr:ASB13 [Branchiostoma lanceolatum]